FLIDFPTLGRHLLNEGGAYSFGLEIAPLCPGEACKIADTENVVQHFEAAWNRHSVICRRCWLDAAITECLGILSSLKSLYMVRIEEWSALLMKTKHPRLRSSWATSESRFW